MEYIMRRIEWCRSGSAMGAKTDMLDENGKKWPQRNNKRTASSHIERHVVYQYLNRLPILYTTAVRKMENGKGRVLLPTDVIHYYIGSYVLD